MISEKLMMAVLSLDAYSRTNGDEDLQNDVALFNMDELAPSIGGATVVNVRNIPESSFVGVNYSWNGKTVLAFRGTDNTQFNIFNGEFFGSDIWNGWTIGAGWSAASQAQLAQDFYTSQTGKGLFEEASDVILTGHSLGGGLAGYLSALNGTTAYGFDHMTFGPAAEATIVSHLNALAITDPSAAEFAAAELQLPDASHFIGTHVEGEILEGVRNGTYAMAGIALPLMYTVNPAPFISSLGWGASWLLASMSTAQQNYESGVANSWLGTPGWDGSANARHSQALLVMLQYARDEVVGGQATSSGFLAPLLDSLYKNSIATSVGITSSQNPELDPTASGSWEPYDLMMLKIAYSVLDSGSMPFGDSAVRSLFNDADAVGAFLNDGGNSLLDVSGLADNIASFAGFQAHNAVLGQYDGFVSLDGNLLGVDYRQATWTFGQYAAVFSGDAKDFSAYLSDHKLDSTEISALTQGPGRIEYGFYSNAAGGWAGQISFESTQYTVRAFGTGVADNITGTNGDEQILLGGGNDTVKANGGVNWIDGGDGDDKLIDDNAWSKFEITKNGDLYYFALRDSGTDPRIHVLENMELFQLGGTEFDAGTILNQAPTGIGVQSIGGSTTAGLAQDTYGIGSAIIDLCAIDLNAEDTFTWQILGNAASIYEINSAGVVTTKAAVTYDYATWRGAVGALTYQQWLADPTQGSYAGLDSKYCFTVRATDSYGITVQKNVLMFLDAGSNKLIGTPNADNLVGGPGRTVIAGLGGADTISDSNWMVLDYSASGAGVKLEGSGYRVYASGGDAQGDVITAPSPGVWDVIGSAFADEVIGAWEVWSGAGNDIIQRAGIVHAGTGYDKVYAWSNRTSWIDFGTGGGELYLASARHFVDMELGVYQQFHIGNVPNQPPTSILDHTLTVVGDFDKLYGSNQDDDIYGSSRNDTIYGGGGIDKIWGLGGNDRIEGYGMLSGGAGNDTIIYLGSGGAWGDDGDDLISSAVGYAVLYGGDGNDTLTSTGAAGRLVGGAGADTLISNGPTNSSNFASYEYATAGVAITYNGVTGSGSAGEALGDTLSGKFGFYGSAYVDIFNVTLPFAAELRAGAGDDVIVVNMSSYSVVYGNGVSSHGDTDDDNDMITNIGAGGTIYGGKGNDTISGKGTLYGDAGRDTIMSGAGSDHIYLGIDTDIDTFVFSRLQGNDVIHDFTSIDVIDIGAGYQYDDFSDILANATQYNDGVQLRFDGSTTLFLLGYNKANLMASNFDFT